jgi:hypothetical protein
MFNGFVVNAILYVQDKLVNQSWAQLSMVESPLGIMSYLEIKSFLKQFPRALFSLITFLSSTGTKKHISVSKTYKRYILLIVML